MIKKFFLKSEIIYKHEQVHFTMKGGKGMFILVSKLKHYNKTIGIL